MRAGCGKRDGSKSAVKSQNFNQKRSGLMVKQSLRISTGIVGAVLVLTLFLARAQAEPAEPAAQAEPAKGWEGSFNLGLTATTGNSRASTGNASIEAKLTRPESITGLGASATYGKSEGKTTADKSNAFAHYNYLITERFSAYLNLEWERDRIADLVWRI